MDRSSLPVSYSYPFDHLYSRLLVVLPDGVLDAKEEAAPLGRIETAVQLRESGKVIQIASEAHWTSFLHKASLALQDLYRARLF